MDSDLSVPEKKTNWRVGYWMTDKKIRRLKFEAFVKLCRSADIELVKLSFERPLEQQGPFDVILHKLSDHVASHVADGGQGSATYMKIVQNYLLHHRGVIMIDPIENVLRLLDRHEQYEFVQDCKGIDEDIQYFVPGFAELTSSDVELNKKLLAEKNIRFPIVCKPSISHCYGPSARLKPDQEEMAIVFNEAGLRDVTLPCVAQSFVNHNARLFKIFIIGSFRCMIQRPSIKNFTSADQTTIFFNSNDVSKSYSASDLNRMSESEYEQPIIEPDERKMLQLVSAIQKKLGLDLLGIDIIIENGTGRYGVIDINAFPGYDGVEEFFPALLKLIQSKLPVSYPLAVNGVNMSVMVNDEVLPKMNGINGDFDHVACQQLNANSNCVTRDSSSWRYFPDCLSTECGKSSCGRPDGPMSESVGRVESQFTGCNGH